MEVRYTLEAANIAFFDIEKVSHNDAKMQLFKVIIDCAKVDEALLPNQRSEGVGCHQFYFNSPWKTSLERPMLRGPAVQKDKNATNPKCR